ncbi:hypothetical protein [Nocardia cyriacigeorgica]|uniref:hypothetical protein n=1 Tax=Nocardia cyriacigeorgica TaxID=135487 RepID=UPI0006624DA0|nr:hypothetical protein [Nocardia cyriacigeorgica]MBF6287604.1 hypothetical protein [Nocardia cyriacigeorgica]MBF6425292.1 hypothetical protein [Nocardia cyriacigeorgica]
MAGEEVLAAPVVCGVADVELAHRVMRRHRECRVERCAWKWVAYCTLVHVGRLAPQSVSPRERAYRRGIEFGTAATASDVRSGARSVGLDATVHEGASVRQPTAMTDLATLRQVLDGLTRYAGEGREG